MDHEALAKQLVRALRGQRSQVATNRRLRRASNVAHAWERGTRSPAASDFFRLAALARVDVAAVLGAFAESELDLALAPREVQVSTWIRHLMQRRPLAELSAVVGRDRNTLARWRRGVTEPRLPDLLRLVDVVTLRLVEFVGQFADPEQLPAIRGAHRDLDRQLRLAYDMPWAHAVLRVLELEAYQRAEQHEAGFIARQIGIDRDLEEQCLQALARAGQIRKRRGKWVVLRVLSVDTRDDPARNAALKKHWAKVSLQRLEQGALQRGGLFSYNLFAISEEGLEEIRKAHLEYFARLRSIVASCTEPSRLVLANIQLVPLDV